MAKAKQAQSESKWSLLIGIIAVIAIVVGIFLVNNNKPQIDDYVGKDAKQSYEELTSAGHEVEFAYDYNNKYSGYTKEDFQDFIIRELNLDTYSQAPYTITKQENDGNKAILYIKHDSLIESEKAKEDKKAALEEKLGVSEAMTACQMYGKRTHRDFDMHSVLGQIAQEAKDENTWYLKYTVDADGYEGLTMECYVTGTSAAPEVTDFIVY